MALTGSGSFRVLLKAGDARRRFLDPLPPLRGELLGRELFPAAANRYQWRPSTSLV